MKIKSAQFTLLSIVLVAALLQGCSSSLADFLRWMERTKTGVSEESVQIGEHKIAYLEGGRGETIVLLHGFADSKDSWGKFARPLTKKYHVIIPDLPGFSASSKVLAATYDTKSQIVRLHDFFARLGLTKFHLAGNSLGGLLSGIYAIEYPAHVSSLCLMDAAGIANIETSDYEKHILQGVNPLIVETPQDRDYERLRPRADVGAAGRIFGALPGFSGSSQIRDPRKSRHC